MHRQMRDVDTWGHDSILKCSPAPRIVGAKLKDNRHLVSHPSHTSSHSALSHSSGLLDLEAPSIRRARTDSASWPPSEPVVPTNLPAYSGTVLRKVRAKRHMMNLYGGVDMPDVLPLRDSTDRRSAASEGTLHLVASQSSLWSEASCDRLSEFSACRRPRDRQIEDLAVRMDPGSRIPIPSRPPPFGNMRTSVSTPDTKTWTPYDRCWRIAAASRRAADKLPKPHPGLARLYPAMAEISNAERIIVNPRLIETCGGTLSPQKKRDLGRMAALNERGRTMVGERYVGGSAILGAGSATSKARRWLDEVAAQGLGKEPSDIAGIARERSLDASSFPFRPSTTDPRHETPNMPRTSISFLHSASSRPQTSARFE